MADRRISQLAAADTLVENDLLPFVDISATETKRIAAENLGAGAGCIWNDTRIGRTNITS
jgi:hypothetical protein